MKILYSAGNRLGAHHQLQNFIKFTKHEVKIGAYPKFGKVNNITWNLEAAKNNLLTLQEDIKKYYPDFVLIDSEPIIANIAYNLDIPILYCSTLHLLDGCIWPKYPKQYTACLKTYKKILSKLPFSILPKLIYSPFGDFSISPDLKKGFEWIQPYNFIVDNSVQEILLSTIEDILRYKEFNNIIYISKLFKILNSIDTDIDYTTNLSKAKYLLTEGATQYISDAMYNKKKLCISPNVQDPENILNALLCSINKISPDIGQIELTPRVALNTIEKSITKFDFEEVIQISNHKKLHERIDELWGM
jgi:hypothetical protein